MMIVRVFFDGKDLTKYLDFVSGKLVINRFSSKIILRIEYAEVQYVDFSHLI